MQVQVPKWQITDKVEISRHMHGQRQLILIYSTDTVNGLGLSM